MRRPATAGSAPKLRQPWPSTGSTTCRRPSSVSPATIRRCPCFGSSTTTFRASHALLMRYVTRLPNNFKHPAMNGERMTTFNLPDLGEGLAEAEIVRWHVKLGEQVKVDQPMVAVETAKAVVEVPSPYSGMIRVLHGKPGDIIATGAPLVEFDVATAPTSTRAAPATPAARPAADDSGTVVGSMPTTSEEELIETAVAGGDRGAPRER